MKLNQHRHHIFWHHAYRAAVTLTQATGRRHTVRRNQFHIWTIDEVHG